MVYRHFFFYILVLSQFLFFSMKQNFHKIVRSKLKTVYRYKNYQNETCCRYPDYTERSEPDPELVLEDGDYTFIKVGTAIIPS